MSQITGAIRRYADGSLADGVRCTQLAFPIVSSHIYLLAIDYPEMASDKNSSMRLFLTDYCKALSNAVCLDVDLH